MNLSDCDAEPIHVPGTIQPHGVLLLLDPQEERVTAAAGDLEGLMNVRGDPVGRPFEALVGFPLAPLTKAAGFKPGQEPLFLETFRAGEEFPELDIIAHERDGILLVELEPSLRDRPSAARLLSSLRAGVGRIKESRTIAQACSEAAEAVRLLSGFDRVVAYQFLDDGSGVVIAESLAGKLGSLLNQHFPASDVPQQARRLYLRNLVRAIPQVDYKAAPLLPAPLSELDMSDCALRAISPIHLEYLRNMGVSASMSLSIVLGNELWGLIACHGTETVLVPYEMREACKHLATGLTQQIETIRASERAQEASRLATRREDFLANLAEADAVEAEIRRQLPQMLDLIPASAVAVCHHGSVSSYGPAPSDTQLHELCIWARRREGTRPYSTHALADEYPPAVDFADRASGLLAINAGLEDPLEILWLRPEYVETIEWAGFPHKPGGGTEPQPLTPRASFAVWRETATGRAVAWTEPEVDAARRLRDGIERIRERQRLNALQSKVVHMSRVNAMGTMASAIAHELNQPLTIIRNYATGLLRLIRQENSESEVADVIGRVSDQALRAGEIVRHMRQLVSCREASLKPTVLHEVVESACSIALLDAAAERVVNRVAIPSDLRVLADEIQIQQVLMNLARNAFDALIMLEAGRERCLEILASRVPEGLVQVTVRDTGDGLPQEVRDKLFSAFNSSKEEGLGIGLSICRTIVEAHGGRIWLDEADQKGTAFCFTLQEVSPDD